ncbi:PREDICTED: xanthine dehydrogenase/oxidase-like [Ceratosolen solmsi marchali]|uniref:Xanthine dehydrogenase/oxidase-like n=1 Tax=Ceratosolen solmsi marchali TaxID=326594 RepID=A0AAJ7DVY9_9HYME|nr:PREDICTED: xanthine dehydrogenase/oxidase-like [Ceratosolen solmsi marchali]
MLPTVSVEVPIDTSLNTFIRETAKLKGTKAMCHEGGCGACIVAANIHGDIRAVNSCLVPIYICNDWKITTIEGLGNRQIGYHTLQAALAEMNGSQCGYCSPGWIMSMHSLMEKGKMTMKEIENSFAGNICRCTGYRPILDTFKSFATDAPPVMKSQIKDIEELHRIKSCRNCPEKMCSGKCEDIEIIYKSSIPRFIELHLKDNVRYYEVLSINEIFDILRKKKPNESYVINGGNTAHGVYRLPKVQIYININNVAELYRIEMKSDTLTLGGNITLAMAKRYFEKYLKEPGFRYLKFMARHIDLVASIPIRNIGTVAGNLMIKNQHNNFPSDIFLIFEAAGAQIHILDSLGAKSIMTLNTFLKTDMNKKLIYSIVLPKMSEEYKYQTYKIMPRAQNAHAIVNAGFLFKLDSNGKVLEKPNIIFGGINPEFLHATQAEESLIGKSIFNTEELKKSLNILNSELKTDYILPDYKPEFRRLLAVSLFYKFILSIDPAKVSPKLQSGAALLQRELSSGKQDYDTNRNLWPINMPVPKLESLYQTSGEAEYIGDIVMKDQQVFCALTIADAPGKIEKIECDEAMKIDGVIAFYSAKDVPGVNAFINSANKFDFLSDDEVLFADKEIAFAGQIFGMIVATSQKRAEEAASKVKIIYPKGPKPKPLITVHDVIASNDKTRISKQGDIPATQPAGKDIAYNIKGSYETGPQYHFSMETQICVCIPVEDGMDVFPATHWMDLTQASVANVLNVPINSINIKIRRLGGSYGAKLTRGSLVACACALACHKLNRPARLVMSIEDNMRAVGKRVPSYTEYDLSVNKLGKIQKMDVSYWANSGSTFNDQYIIGTLEFFFSCYDSSIWSTVGYNVKSDLPSNTWCRAPGSTEAIATVENIMERIARETKQDPTDVKIRNMNTKDKEVLEVMIAKLKTTTDYEKRREDIEKFNSENRWKKRGISLVPMKYPVVLLGSYNSLVSIYGRDGTVSVSHGGIELGQGIHTKMAQIAAYTLGIDLKMVSVKPSNNLITPNNYATGNSTTTDACGYATQRACKILLERLEPIKQILGGNPSWQELVFTAQAKNVDLCASFMFTVDQELKPYPLYAVAVSEVEVDVLTGQHLIRRVDILEDTGVSLNPKIDVGQVEGAFVMGIGYWTCEDLIFDPETGALTNYRTWNYKVPGAMDIPIDFRISFNRKVINPVGILRSKAIGEPPLCLSCSVPIAIRHALDSARADAGNKDVWYQLG